LTAAHLAELSARFGGRVELVLSAYNAGVAQTQAWLNGHGCSDPWAFASAVPFQETRAYIQGILSSRMAYHFLADR
jgi:soluble lytic murein transglycosylase